MKEYPIPAAGFEGRGLALIYTGWQGEPHLVIDEREAAPGPKRGQFRLVGNDGMETLASIRFQNFGVRPVVVIRDVPYKMPSTIRWYGWLWSAIPLMLVVVGGLAGGLVGAVAFMINIQAFRSEKGLWQKLLLTLAISIAAWLVYLAVSTLLVSLFRLWGVH